MDMKITLEMDSSVIDSIEKYSADTGKNISKITEDFFRRLTSPHYREIKISPLVKELSGAISENDLHGLDYTKYLQEKYE